MSGCRAVEVRIGVKVALKTPVMKEMYHLYDGQGGETFNYLAEKDVTSAGMGLKDAEPESLAESIAAEQSGGEVYHHPLGYLLSEDPATRHLDATEELEGKGTMPSSSLSMPCAAALGKGSAEVLAEIREGPGDEEDGIALGEEAGHPPVMRGCSSGVLDASIEASPTKAVFGEHSGGTTIALSLQPPEDDRESQATVSTATALSGKACARSYIEALVLSAGQKTSNLGNLYHHATQYESKIGTDKTADPHILELSDHLKKFA